MANMLDYLAKRGINQGTATRYELTLVQDFDRPALRYPTFGTEGGTATRYKYIDGDITKSKNRWGKGKPDDCVIYDNGHLAEAIKAADGILWLLNGEPAVWAFDSYSATKRGGGYTAATCSFGEGSNVEKIVPLLTGLGVKILHMPIDSDMKGYSAAYKYWHAFKDSGIDLCFYTMPYPITEDKGKDWNDVWIDKKFDALEMTLWHGDAKCSVKYVREVLGAERVAKIDALFNVTPMDAMAESFRGATKAPGNGGTLDAGALYKEWIESVVSRLGHPKREGSTTRYHCPAHPTMGRGEDKNPSLRIAEKGGVPWPMCSCDIQNQKDAWDILARAVGASTWEQFKAERVQNRREAAKPNGATPNTAQAVETPDAKEARRKRVVQDSHATLMQLMALADGNVEGIGNSVIFPMRALWHVGGMCHYIPSGKLVGLVGGSGQGKTSATETWIDFHCRMGLHPLVDSPEWTPLELQARRIQRYSGQRTAHNGTTPHIMAEDFNGWIMWCQEARNGIPEEQRLGKKLGAEHIAEIQRVTNIILSWPGKSYSLYEDDAGAPPLYLEDKLEFIADTISDGRKSGQRMDVVYFDYLQIEEVKENPDSEKILDYVISRIKNHSIHNKYVGFCVSQVTKAASKDSKTSGKMLTSDDAHYVRSDKFNLMLTLNREYEELEGERVPTNWTKLYIDKNSQSKGGLAVRVPIDLSHLMLLDKVDA